MVGVICARLGHLGTALLVWGSAPWTLIQRRGAEPPTNVEKRATVTDFEGRQWVMCF